jgi:diguanylate cyclase
MTSAHRDNGEPIGRLFSWLGLKKAADSAHPIDPITSSDRPRSLSQDARRALMQSIMDFLIDHGLDISPDNLILAYGAFSGANPAVARRVTHRLQTGEPVTQVWIDEVRAETGANRDQLDVEKVMQRLETQVDSFQAQAKQARNITVQYGSELEKHVDDLESVEKAGELVSDLAELARAMLDRTRRAEQDMRRSEEEVRVLRRNLARARRDAEVDHLTGLPNRRAFEALLNQQHKDAIADQEALSVAFCDIDEFKRINDTHGHDSGDRVIKVIAETLSRISDDKCHVARHGGEEFVMLFRGLTPHQAAEKLDAAREAMAQRKLINRKTDQPFGQITFSGGVADVFGYADVREALRSADEALYRAKEKGRNRIEIA